MPAPPPPIAPATAPPPPATPERVPPPAAPDRGTAQGDEPAAEAPPVTARSSGESGGLQHLVQPGQDLGEIIARAAPGDEVIVWPGTYVGATVRGLVGRPDAPIVVKGLRPDEPPVIDGGAWGLRLLGARHVHVQDLVVRGSRIDGIEVAPGEDGTASRDVRFERVRVEDVGHRAGRHGFSIVRAVDVELRDVRVAGWTGSGIEIVGSHGVVVDGAELRGRDRGELLGIRLRAGSRGAIVRGVRLVEPGLGAIALGGRSRDADFPADDEPDRDGRRWEVVAPTIEDVLVVGGEIGLAFLGATRASINHLTIIDARRAAVRFARPRDDEAFGTVDASGLSRSLFAWRTEAAPVLVEVAPGATDEGLWLEENLWWREAAPLPADAAFPGQASFPQLVDVDPVLAADLSPRAAAARGFGARPENLPSPVTGGGDGAEAADADAATGETAAVTATAPAAGRRPRP